MSLPWDNLNDYVHDWMKGLQEIVDSIAPDPGEDNSMLPLASLPYRFDCTLYCVETTRKLIDGYDAWDKGYGYQPWLIGYRLNLTNNVLRVVNQEFMGKCSMSPPDRWGWLTNEDIATIEAAGREVYSRSIEVVNNYPTNTIKVIGGNYGTVSFKPLLHDVTDIQIKYPCKNDAWYTYAQSLIGATTSQLPVYNENTGYWEPAYYADHQGTGSQPNYSGYSKLIAVFDSISEAENVVGALSSYNTNNDVINYTKAGSEYKLYYGDNYLIYALDDTKIYNYQDLFTGTKQATDGINAWNPSAPPIKTPTYNEVKHEDDPDPDLDDIDDQVMGAGANLGSIARLWLLTRQQLQDLHAAFTSAPANYDPLSSFIGVLGFGVQPLKVVGDSLPWTLNPINIRMSSGEVWHTGVEGHIVDSQVSAFSFPDIHIKKRYNNFLDYSPYATHEIFIPMCGWLTLPDIAVDRTISVTYLPDLESMRCRAVVSVVDDDGDKCVIGVKDGIMGSEVPFSNLNHSVWLANLITNAADVAGEIVTGAIGAGFTKTNAKGGTYRPYEGFTIGMAGTLPGAVGNALLSGNVNRTHVVGSNGNRTGFSDGECVMIKSTYHKIDKPDNYDHTIGKVCNKTGQLSEFHGFTVCDNPHINISALDEEKEEIKRLLEEGVILPSGE